MFKEKLEALGRSAKSLTLDRLDLFAIAASIVIIIIHWAIVYFKIGAGKSRLLLHYNVIYGTDLVQAGWYVYFIPAIATILLVFNLFLSRYFGRREKLASYFLNYSNIVIQLIFLVASMIVIHANS